MVILDAYGKIENRANVLRAMANSGDINYYDEINRHLTDEDERVRQIAALGIRKLNLQV